MDFAILNSDEVLLQAAVASDVASLWRRLARTSAVRTLAAKLASDPDELAQLCAWAKHILQKPYDRSFRHPDDAAICAALLILEQSPLCAVRAMFAQLRRAREGSLVWVQRMAEYCDNRFVDCNAPSYYQRVEVGGPPFAKYLEAGTFTTGATATSHDKVVA